MNCSRQCGAIVDWSLGFNCSRHSVGPVLTGVKVSTVVGTVRGQC